MVWLLLIVTGVLAVMVGALHLRVRRLERGSSARPPAATGEVAEVQIEEAAGDPSGEAAEGYVITRVGTSEPEVEPGTAAGSVSGPVFADLVLKETVVQTASLLHGLRRALAPETRNRIRFHMRQEVKRSRKQRRADLREMRREWASRDRAATAQDPAA